MAIRLSCLPAPGPMEAFAVRFKWSTHMPSVTAFAPTCRARLCRVSSEARRPGKVAFDRLALG